MTERQHTSRREGFRLLPNDVFFAPRAKQIKGDGYRVLAAVEYFDRNGRNGRHCDASYQSIANLAQCDIKTVQRSIAKLVQLGFITIIEKRRGRGKSNVYAVVWNTDDVKQDTAAPFSEEKTGQISPENRTVEHAKQDTSRESEKQDQSLVSDKETEGDLKGNHAKRDKDTSRERAPLQRSGGYLNSVAWLAVDRFGSKAEKFIDPSGTFNIGGFLTWLDREGQRKKLNAQEIDSLLEVADAAVGYYDRESDEFGLAYRITIEGGWAYTDDDDTLERV